MLQEEQLATLGEYNNYFSEGLFVELTEPLFVKKNWVPQWLWTLVSDPRLSYFEHERQATVEGPTKDITFTDPKFVSESRLSYLELILGRPENLVRDSEK